MSLLLCKYCYSEYNLLKGHYCLNGQWIPGVPERNLPPQSLAGDLMNLRPESTLGAHCEVDTRISGAGDFNAIREFFNENLLSNQVIFANLNPNSSNHGLAPVGTSNRLMTIDYGHSHIGECSIGSSNDLAFNINVPDANYLHMPIRHGFPNSEIPLNVDGLTSRVSEMGLDDASLCIPSISNTSLNMPFFPPMNGSNDGMITNQIPSGYEFQNVEPHTTMQNDGLKYINRMVEESHDYDMSRICYENLAINKNVITWPKSLNETETENNLDNCQWPEMNRGFAVNSQSSQNIPMENAFESTTENFTTTGFETGWPSMFSDIPTHESFFYYGSIKEHVRLDTGNGAMPLRNSSDDVYPFPGPSFSQPNERNKSECSKRSQSIYKTEPPSVVNIRAKRFICSVCQKGFEKKSYLRRHMNIHESVKPYKCNVCGKSFGSNGPLKSHLLIHRARKPFECEFCGKSFSQKVHLNLHVLTHTGEKPFECEVCKKTFRHRETLKEHAHIHTGEKPFECEICKKSFRHRSTLRQHSFTHAEDKPIKCEICGKKLKHKRCMKKHVQTHKSRQNP